jgi:hypothetical protein
MLASPFSWLPQLDDITPDSLSSVSHSLVQGWIKKCDSTHTLCHLQKSSMRPKRLLYILPSDDNIVQLVSGAGDEPYIALSHCWGKGGPTRTTMVNESGMKRGILISELFKSFQDAVKVVRWIGIQYLWTDSLCIVQDDQEDWQQESKNRADIYVDVILRLEQRVLPIAILASYNLGNKRSTLAVTVLGTRALTFSLGEVGIILCS